MATTLLIITGILVTVLLWLREGMHDKELGLEQFIGWPLSGLVLVALGLWLLAR